MGQREYPPAVKVHGIGCAEVTGLLLSRLPMHQIARDHPNGSPHLACLSGGDTVGVIEVVEYPPHAYEESSQRPADASRPLCAYCGGTHGVLDALVLPPGVATGLPSTTHR
jgi:hypothetical protein